MRPEAVARLGQVSWLAARRERRGSASGASGSVGSAPGLPSPGAKWTGASAPAERAAYSCGYSAGVAAGGKPPGVTGFPIVRGVRGPEAVWKEQAAR